MSSATSPSYTCRPPADPRDLVRVRPARVVRWAMALAAVGLGMGLVLELPWVLGTTWPDVVALVHGVPASVLAGLVALWFAGLLVHLPVLRAALPGLTSRQALGLNLAGSAVANVLPAGGAAGVGVGFAMTRRWGFSPEQFTSFALVSNLWNAAARLVVGAALLVGAVGVGVPLPSGARTVVICAAATLLTAVALGAPALSSERAARVLAAGLARIWRRAPRRLGGRTDRRAAVMAWLLASRRAVVVALGCGWRRMTLFVLAYVAMQGLLLLGCLDAVHAGAPLGAVAVAFGLERLISLAPVTPGAAGVA
ncbi:hypothetical protein [Nocardioides fonticola]